MSVEEIQTRIWGIFVELKCFGGQSLLVQNALDLKGSERLFHDKFPFTAHSREIVQSSGAADRSSKAVHVGFTAANSLPSAGFRRR